MEKVPDKRLYRFPDTLRYKVHFRFDKKWISKLIWAGLPKASQAILPVIGAHCDWQGLACPSEITIAALAGISAKSVRYGLRGLEKFRGLSVRGWRTPAGKWARCYKVRMPPAREQDRYLRIHKCLFEGGNWQALSRPGRALYPVLRWVADAQGDPAMSEDNAWDVCTPVLSQLATYAGISRPSVYTGLADLARNWLIECAGDENGALALKVYRVPPRAHPPQVLNQKVTEKFGGAAANQC